MGASKLYHVNTPPVYVVPSNPDYTDPCNPAGVYDFGNSSYTYYHRDALIQGSLFSPAIGDVIVYDEVDTIDEYIDRHDNTKPRAYYSIVG